MNRHDESIEQGDPTTFNVLFVCTGNTCRSPMAEAIMRHRVAERGWTHITVSSAGIAAAEGEPAADNAIEVLRQEGIDHGSHAARRLTPDLVDWADLVLVMSPAHRQAVELLGGTDKVALVTDFEEGAEIGGRPVEDPYGADLVTYRRTYRQLDDAIEAVLLRIEPIIAP